ncbi:Clathrin/coatomer adaptor adaptin-like protein [Neofusicoccum parvum]|nr:Clathrin/coatomer adaptor adaptin-like protein [Neofusicoccum parvum]
MDQPPPLPEDYRIKVIKGILEMCSRDMYANINDFDWYIDVLVQLVRVSPSASSALLDDDMPESDGTSMGDKDDVSFEIGRELQNVAVRVKAVRPEATEAAQSLVLVDRREQMFPSSGNGGQGVLGAAAWIVGEYASLLTNPEGVLNSLMHSSSALLPNHILAVYIQAVPKVFSSLSSDEQTSWTSERKSTMVLLMARIIHFLEPLAMHPNLEVQERAVEYLELMRLASEAASGQEAGSRDGEFVDPPLLLTQAIPSLFTGFELNPVALGAQKKVPIPDELDLDTPINADLPNVLRKADYDSYMEPDEDDVYQFYNQRAAAYVPPSEAAADRLDLPEAEPKSYQASAEEEYLDPDIVARRKAERRARNKDDPFYIPTDNESGRSTPLHNLLKTNNGDDLDIDSIPIMDLDLETRERLGGEQRSRSDQSVPQQRRKVRKNFEILVDENLGPDEGGQASDSSRPELARPTQTKGKKSLLEVDSTGLAALSLEETGNSKLDMERREAEEAEMAKALKEVERLRLEMQRASERIQAKDVPPEGQLVKRKKKKAKKEVKGEPAAAPAAEESQKAAGEGEGEGAATAVKKKKKKAKKQEDGAAAEGAGGDDGAAPEARPKKKKKRRPVLLDDAEGGAEASVG